MSNPNKLTASEQKLLIVLHKANGGQTIAEIAEQLGQTKNSCQVLMSNVRKKVVASGYNFPEPRKMARGGGGNSVDLNEFMSSLD